jgi:hypothetical protein
MLFIVKIFNYNDLIELNNFDSLSKNIIRKQSMSFMYYS